MTKLKPCPFCGHQAYLYEKKIKLGWLVEIGCSDKYKEDGTCVFHPSFSIIAEVEQVAHNEVVEKWNTRKEKDK